MVLTPLEHISLEVKKTFKERNKKEEMKDNNQPVLPLLCNNRAEGVQILNVDDLC